jgi:hypothetical protein
MKQRELALLLILLISVSALAVYYFTPLRGEIAALNAQIAETDEALEEAELRLMKLGALSGYYGEKEWRDALANASRAFDDAEFIRRCKAIIPYEVDVSFAFPDRPAEDGESGVTEIRAIELKFKAPYGTVRDLLEAFARQDYINRVARLQYDVSGSALDVRMLVEVLSSAL